MFKSTIRTGKKCDLSDFHHDMIVGARRTGLNISVTADLLGFSAVFRVDSEWCKKYPVIVSSVDRNALLMRDVVAGVGRVRRA